MSAINDTLLKYLLSGVICISMALSACGSTPKQVENSNTELIVTYNGKEVHRRGSRYIGEPRLREILESGEDAVIIFSADWCSGCKLARNAIKKAKLKIDVHYLNMDEPWVQKLATIMEIKNVPLMIHIGSEGTTKAARLGAGPIVIYLITRY